MTRRLIVKKLPEEGPDGDRATKNSPYFSYELVLIREGIKDLLLEKIDGFDHWYTHIRPKEDVLQELDVRLGIWENALELKAEHKHYKRKVRRIVEYEEIEEE